MMKIIIAALAITATSAAFVCDEECAGLFYEALAGVPDTHGLTDLDLAYYAYMLYQNYSEAGNVDVVNNFMAGMGEDTACGLDEDWQRADIVSCFEDATDEDVETSLEAFPLDGTDEQQGYARVMGIMANHFAPGSKLAEAFPSELSGTDTAHAINVYTTFMTVVGAWETLEEACQDAIKDAAGYEAGDDAVLAIADNAEAIQGALAGDDCDGTEGVEALVSDLEEAVVLADKLTGEAAGEDADADDEESSAAMISAFVGLIAFML